MSYTYTIKPPCPVVDFSEVDDAADLVALSFSQGGVELPDDPTPEQFAQAEPIIIQMALEQQIDPFAFNARDRGEPVGNIIDPIDMKRVRRVAPAHYQGVFTHEGQAYKFSIKPQGSEFRVVYAPILRGRI